MDTQKTTSETRLFPILRKRRQFRLVKERQKDSGAAQGTNWL